MEQNRYFIAPAEIFDGGQRIGSNSNALVSANSIFRVLEDSAEVRRAFLERRILTVRLQDHDCLLHGRLVREVGRDGIHYNLRIMDLVDESRSQVAEVLGQRGFGTPWKREFPRIPVAPILQTIEVPSHVVFPRIAGEMIGEVVNFSYHGMFFEFQCSGLSLTEQVDQVLRIKIITSSRMALHNVEAQIVHIYDEACDRGKIVRGLGVKFLSMRKEVRRKYDGMILEVCRGVRKES